MAQLQSIVDIQLRSQVNSLLELKFSEHKKYFVCDLSRVNFVDSSGLGILISMTKKVNTQNGRLVLAHLNPSIRELLALSHLDQIFNIYPNVKEALESFEQD